MARDLLGTKIKARRPHYEAMLERRDHQSLVDRASRVRWLNQKLPKGGLLMPADSMFVFSEAKSTFVNGYYISTIVLAAAFAEHWMSGILTGRGWGTDCKSGLRACVRCAREHEVWPDFVLSRIDRLQSIRNPFIHLKDFNHEHSLIQRSWASGRDPDEVLEEDAKQALETICALVQS
jgi:hypothetical protein